MSIVIKGMEMPKNCDYCFFIRRGWPDWCSLPQIPHGEDEIDDIKKRPDWCPLVALPEKHGRLIDADDLIADYDRVHVGEPGGARILMENATTIIEAEEAEE